ncbi:hypothetical protein [Mycobacterium avium]
MSCFGGVVCFRAAGTADYSGCKWVDDALYASVCIGDCGGEIGERRQRGSMSFRNDGFTSLRWRGSDLLVGFVIDLVKRSCQIVTQDGHLLMGGM